MGRRREESGGGVEREWHGESGEFESVRTIRGERDDNVEQLCRMCCVREREREREY